jgi:starch synthase
MKKQTEKINVLFASFEAVPFSKTGGLGDVTGSLPGHINSTRFDVRVILPKLGIIPERYKKKMTPIAVFSVPLGWRNVYCGLETMRLGGVTYYFIDNEYYFKRDKIYGEFDDGERMAYFSKAVLESILHIDDFMPDIIHCNDWHTALIPVFLHEMYMALSGFEKIKTIFTVHNLKFQGQYSDFVIGDVCGLAGTPAEHQLRIGEAANYMLGALRYTDMITTVSPSYAEEICTRYYGEGLDWIFNEKKDRLRGILNGINYKLYKPVEDKKAAKAALQKELGLKITPGVPLLCVISRLTEQKGMDLISYNLPMFRSGDMQLAILGTGDPTFENAFRYYADKYPDNISARMEFNEPLSRRIYAGSDIFLMPSRFEPCGLSQMIAMRYGTLPIVRETGGLKDTVIPYNKYTGDGTGFSFANYNAHELKNKIEEAYGLYTGGKKHWNAMMKSAMNQNFSWTRSAKEYRKLYQELL